MSAEVGKKHLIFNRKFWPRRNLEIDFFGGEPLMNFEVVKEIVKYGREIEEKYNKNSVLPLQQMVYFWTSRNKNL